MKPALKQTIRFLIRHWPHVLIAVPMVIGVTALHESAHALAVVVQGGEVLQFSIWPDGDRWGFVTYRNVGSHFAVAIAPYAMWVGMMIAAAALAMSAKGWPFAPASTVFIWGYVVPFGDIANTWTMWVGGAGNDFAHAFGGAGLLGGVGLAAACVLVVVAGYPVHRRLYGEAALPLAGYAALGGAAIALVAALGM